MNTHLHAAGGRTHLYLDPGPEELARLRSVLREEWAGISDEELIGILGEALEGMTPAEVENVLDWLKGVNWGGVATGALGGAATGATIGSVFPGYGTAIGGGIGAVAGGLAGALAGGPSAAPRPAQRPPSPRPAAAPGPAAPLLRPVAPRPAPSGPPPRTPPVAGPGQAPPPPAADPFSAAGLAGAASSTIGSLAGVLTAVLQNPQVMSALASAVMGAFGKSEIEVGPGRTPVSRVAVLEMIRVLSELALDEVAALDSGLDAYPHLRGPDGELRVDPALPEARAFELLSILREGAPVRPTPAYRPRIEVREALGPVEADEARPLAPDRLQEASERIVRKLNGDLSALASFRRPVANTTVFPFSSICQLRMQMSNAGDSWFTGTGFYIAPNLLLTAGHCVLHDRWGRATRMIVRPGRAGSWEPFPSFEVAPAQMIAHPRWIASPTSADFDLAVVRVSAAPPHGHFLGVQELVANPTSSIAVCGYAADRSAGVDPDEQNVDYDTIRRIDGDSFTYSLHTTGGTSGSPVFYVEGRRVVAVGVHSRGNDDTTNRGCRLTEAKLAWIRSVGGGAAPRRESAEEAIFAAAEAEFSEESALSYLADAGAFEFGGLAASLPNGR